MVVVVTGASGQVGQALQKVSAEFPAINFRFWSRADADVADVNALENALLAARPHYCINLAAFTAVDRAEAEPEAAYAVNVDGARNVAQACSKFDVRLIHLSTDFVFDGQKRTPYNEDDLPNPINVYGVTKHLGEKEIARSAGKYYIIRASWIFSEFGNNFYKTMIRLSGEGKHIRVVDDQTGCPTYAPDLARMLCQFIQLDNAPFGIYHYCNQDAVTWFDFAKAIFHAKSINADVRRISSQEFNAPAIRPRYSVLDTSKISRLGIPIIPWLESLKK